MYINIGVKRYAVRSSDKLDITVESEVGIQQITIQLLYYEAHSMVQICSELNEIISYKAKNDQTGGKITLDRIYGHPHHSNGAQ